MKKVLNIFILSTILVVTFFCEGTKITAHSKFIYDEKVKFKLMSTNYEGQNIDAYPEDEDFITLKFYLDIDLYVNDELRYNNYDEFLVKAKEYYSTRTNAVFAQLNLSNYESVYVGMYTPIIIYNYSYENYALCKDEIEAKVNSLSDIIQAYVKQYKPNYETSILTATGTSGVNIGDAFWNRTLTGNGVKIGILEPGEVNASDPYFDGVNVTVWTRYGIYTPVTVHATKMAAVIGGQMGIANEADLYSAYLFNDPADEIEWMVQKGVQIINMSFGDGEATGEYNDYSAYFDKVTTQYGIIFVVAAGNYGDTDTKYVANPGLAYNVLTVGSSNYRKERSTHSSYKVVMGPYKPTIVAPGKSIRIGGSIESNEGTSFAAAITTGTIALLLEKYPVLIGQPARVLSLVTANAEKFPNYAYALNNGFDDEIGAGELDFTNCDNHMNTSFTETNTHNQANSFIYTRFMVLFPNQTLEASLAWLIQSDGSVNSRSYTDYDLHLYDDQYQFIKAGASGYNNIETLSYTNTTDSNKIVILRVYQYDLSPVTNEEYGLSYQVTTYN